MRQAITPEELITQWKMRSSTYIKQMKDYPKQRPVLEVMDFQLNKCIKELEAVLSGEYPTGDLLLILNKELKNDLESRSASPGNSAGME